MACVNHNLNYYVFNRTKQDKEDEGNLRERTMKYVTESCRSPTKYCDGYIINIASPKEKNLYFSSTAVL